MAGWMRRYTVPVDISSFSYSSIWRLIMVYAMLMMVLHLAIILPTVSSSGLNSIDDLREFFKETYIRKQIGQMYRDPKNDDKLYYAEMFNPVWYILSNLSPLFSLFLGTYTCLFM